nr:MAG TPA: hypothetical protein [Caudoviricetes sp.]
MILPLSLITRLTCLLSGLGVCLLTGRARLTHGAPLYSLQMLGHSTA